MAWRLVARVTEAAGHRGVVERWLCALTEHCDSSHSRPTGSCTTNEKSARGEAEGLGLTMRLRSTSSRGEDAVARAHRTSVEAMAEEQRLVSRRGDSGATTQKPMTQSRDGGRERGHEARARARAVADGR